MAKVAFNKIHDVARALRKRAAFFYDNDPAQLSKDDFATIGSYLENMADTLDLAIKGDKRKALGLGLATFALYLLLFASLCWLFYDYSPYEDRYYLKLAQEVFSEDNAQQYVFYLRAGMAAFCSLFVFFVSVFTSIIICGVAKLLLPRLVNSVTEAIVSILISGAGFYMYYEYVFKTGLAKSFL